MNRIRQNVIRTGLKKISVSYSRISLRDICEKLHLDTPEDVECIVAKAIRDGIIDAVIDHEGGYVQSKEATNVYNTTEPTNVFHNRIQFVMKIHNDAVKAMSYPPKQKTPAELKAAEEIQKRQEELADEVLEEEEEEEDEF